jgi:hypothetical protein
VFDIGWIKTFSARVITSTVILAKHARKQGGILDDVVRESLGLRSRSGSRYLVIAAWNTGKCVRLEVALGDLPRGTEHDLKRRRDAVEN